MSRLKVALPGCAQAAVLAWMAIVTTAWPALGAAEVADKARPSIGWDIAMMSAPKSYPVEDASISNEYGRIEGVSPVWIEGEDYCGKPTRVFAWWGVPKDASAERKVPAMMSIKNPMPHGPDPAQLFFANIRTAKGEIYSTRLREAETPRPRDLF